MQKPDVRIYRAAAGLLAVDVEECIFVGDGGSDELAGARAAGMKAVQAKWYTDRFPRKRDGIDGFPTADRPFDILRYME